MLEKNEASYADVYNKSLDLLSRREHSRFELVQKLIKRYGSINFLDEVINKLQELKLLDDQRFAEAYIKARTRKGFGPIRLKAELQQRRVSESIINHELSMINNWDEIAYTAFKKKFNSSSSETKETLKAKSFLQNRGFNFDQIEFCIKEA